MLAAMMLAIGCGQYVPTSQPRTVADESYVLSFTRVNLVESASKYHFQLCRQQSVEGQANCFNPFEDIEGNPVVFTAEPAADGLRARGLRGKTLRYVVGTGAVLVFGALALVLVPKAAHLAFTKMLKLRKAAISGKADDVIRHMADSRAEKLAKKSADKAQAKAHKLGKDFDYQEHYERVRKEIKNKTLDDKTASFSKIFATKPALFFTSLFIVEGTIGAWKFSYDSWQATNEQLAKWNWGQKELDLAAAYPFLTSDEPYRVVSVKELLATLREHLQLIYSEDYLREFPPPPPEEETTPVPPMPW